MKCQTHQFWAFPVFAALILSAVGESQASCARSRDLLFDSATAPWNLLDAATLRAEAEVARTNVAQTVTAKSMLPPGGDKHDYMSFGPYWWPDPAKPDGLPYIRRDGEQNPSSLTDSDRVRLEQLCWDVGRLAGAADRLGDHAAGAEACRKLRVFFLDDETAMRPNLNFGQAIPGICAGRGIGIIESRLFVTQLLDALLILRATGDLSPQDEAVLKTWFGEFLDWLTTSKIGLDESREHNNHGTAWDLQVAALAWYVGRLELAKETLERNTKRRIASQIEPDGRQPHELARTRSYTYATMNAELFGQLAQLGERLSVELWSFETPDGRSIRKAFQWLLPYWKGEKPWTYKQITPLPTTPPANLLKISRHFTHE